MGLVNDYLLGFKDSVSSPFIDYIDFRIFFIVYCINKLFYILMYF